MSQQTPAAGFQIRNRQRTNLDALRIATLAGCVLCVSDFAAAAVEITDAEYEGRAQFKIVTENATWFYDKAGGGFSRLIDRDGKDWIGFHQAPLTQFPASAAAGYRGIPNFVHQQADGGAGHPGFDLCESTKLNEHAIRTVSKSGKWRWTWEFTGAFARVTMDRNDPDRCYWFLYEGAAAGRFAPKENYWGTDLGGPRRETPDHIKGADIRGQWRWLYIGDLAVKRVLFLAQTPTDELTDTFSFMGSTKAGNESPDGMVVFGFGREKAKMLLTQTGVRFTLGFIERSVTNAEEHQEVARVIEKFLPAGGRETKR